MRMRLIFSIKHCFEKLQKNGEMKIQIESEILEIMQIFSNLGYSDLKIVFSKKRLGDHCYVVADNKKALKLLNWSPKRNIVDMCKDTINYKKNFLK